MSTDVVATDRNDAVRHAVPAPRRAAGEDRAREREVVAALVRLRPLLAPAPDARARARRRLVAALAAERPVSRRMAS